MDDCGNILNPLIVDGQVHGGVAQGIGQALWEQAVYDDNGQLVTGEFMDYTMPRAHMMPWIESDHTITPSPVNPLGVKGVGEAGTIGCSPAVVNSVVDALSPLGVRHLDMPLTPEKIWKLMAGGKNEHDSATVRILRAEDAGRSAGAGRNGAKPLAGGMSLIPMMKLRLAAPEHLVDLGRIKDLNYIREEGGALHIGATTTHYEVESSALVRAKCPLLAETASAIGDVQVRNMGTIGGSVAHADPAADYPAALQALEAKIVIRGAKGERTVSAADFFVDTFTTALEPGEIVREIVVPVEDAGTGTNYQKMVQPASGFAIVGIAVRVRRSGGKITMARIGVTGLSNSAIARRRRRRRWKATAGSPRGCREGRGAGGARRGCQLRSARFGGLSQASGGGLRGARDHRGAGARRRSG